jgi:LacI family transcriptional regulator
MAHKVTAQDVANLAGVSRSAVSLVLNGRAAGNISLAKQHAVLVAAEQLDYRPNVVAVSLRSRRTRTIGLLSWSGQFSFAQILLRQALQKAHDFHYLLLAVDTDGDTQLERRQLETLRDRQVDGFLVVAPHLMEYEPADVLLTSPTVLLNCVDAHGALTSVAPDEAEAGRRAAEVLLERGHRRLAVLLGGERSLQTRLRVLGIEQAVQAAGLPVPVPVTAGMGIDSGYRAATAVLQQPERPTALICTHERLAVGAALAAAELGLPVPAALSLVGLEDGERLAATLVPPLTTVHRPDAAMAEEAVTLLVQGLDGSRRPEVKHLRFSCQVHARDSVAPPPAP